MFKTVTLHAKQLFSTIVAIAFLAISPHCALSSPLDVNTILPKATVFYHSPGSFSIQSKLLNLSTQSFSNSFDISMYGSRVQSSSYMSLKPAPTLSLDTTVDLPYSQNLGDNAGFNYSFAVSSQLDTDITLTVDYSYAFDFVGFGANSYALARIGIAPTSWNKGSNIKDEDYQFAMQTNQTTPLTNGSFEYVIKTNTIYDVVMRADTFHWKGLSSASVFIDPVLSFVGEGTLLTSEAAGNTHVPTPEPGTMLLMGIGVAGAIFMRRRAKRS